VLDRFGALVLASVMMLLAWRTAIGGMSSYSSQTTTMMLGFPEWIVYAAMVPPLCLTGLIALYQAFIGNFQEQDQ
jgi:TRAP-type C4-dicarboxylate transport system permease small subunit